MKRRTFMLSAPLVLAACGRLPTPIFAPQTDVDRAAYAHPGPRRLTLMTMKNTGSGNGAHSGLMINASQRVLWDPAGTFGHPSIPERHDVLFGITPQIEQFYVSFHSRVTYYTQIQEIDVSPEVAEMAMRLAMANGPTPRGYCTSHTSNMIRQLPGFGSVRKTLFPSNLSDDFAELPGVRSREYRENDADDKSIAAAQINAAITAGQ